MSGGGRGSGPSGRSEEGPDESIVELWIVERIEDGLAILVLDTEDGEPVVGQVAADLLGRDEELTLEEGVVLEVPLGAVGEPVWEKARAIGRL